MKSEMATSRWTAGVLLLVMLVPAFAPFAVGRLAPSAGMHCMRRPIGDAPSAASDPSAASAEPAMHCHHAASRAPQSEPSPASSFRSLDCCCNNDCCCRILKTSDWARPAINHFSFVSLLIQSALLVPLPDRLSAVLIGPDSARAPPRS
jgi:hypothetical protein